MARSDTNSGLSRLRPPTATPMHVVEPPPPAEDRLAPRRYRIEPITLILALTLALLAGAGAALYERSRPAVYSSVAVLLVDQPVAIAVANDDGPLAKLQRLRYQYAGLLNTEVVAGPVARQLKLDPGAVEGSLSALVNPTTFTIGILARSHNPSQTSLIAQAAASQLTSYVAKQQAQNGISPTNRVVLTEVLTPRQGVKVEPTRQRVLVAGAVSFVVVAVLFTVVADLVRRRV